MEFVLDVLKQLFKEHVVLAEKTFVPIALMNTIVMEDWFRRLDNFNRRLLKSKKFWAIIILTKPIKYLIFVIILIKILN